MRGKRKPLPAPSASVKPPRLHPRDVFTVHTATAFLGLPLRTLRTEIKEGRLRFAMRAGRILILGARLLQWVRRGERNRGAAPAPLDQLRRAWEKAGPEERAAFLSEAVKE